MGTRTASILHNVAVDAEGVPLAAFGGYRAEHPMAVVFRADLPSNIPVDQALEVLFDELSGTATSLTATAYTKVFGLRPLAVGDVVGLDNQWWACASHGWKYLAQEPVMALRSHPRAWTIPEQRFLSCSA